MPLFPLPASCLPLGGHAAPASRFPLRSFLILLSSFLLLCISPASARAESSLYIKPDDDQVRATERLHDFLEDTGYTVEYLDEDKDVLIIHQQKHRIHTVILVGENELSSIVLSVHYHLNKKAATPAERAAYVNLVNASQYGVKACVDEEREDFYLEYILPFDGFLTPRTIKRFADQAVARTYLMVANDKALNAAIFGEGDDASDSAKNADEDEAAEDGEPAAKEEATAVLSPSSTPEPPSPGAAVPPSASLTPPSSPEQPSSRAAEQPSSVPPSSPEQPSSRAAEQPSASPSLVPEVPPTTPAEPARTRKARA